MGEEAELVRPGDAAQAGGFRGDVDGCGVHQGFQPEVLQDGGKEEEELHVGQAFAQTHPLACVERRLPSRLCQRREMGEAQPGTRP